MAYAVDNTQQFQDFLIDQYGTGTPATNTIDHYLFHPIVGVPFFVSVDTAQGTGANLEVLTPTANEISVATTSPEPLQFVVDQNSSATTEDFDVSGTGAIGVLLTAPNVDFTLTGTPDPAFGDAIYAGAGNDTIDASAAHTSGLTTIFTGSGNDTVTGDNGGVDVFVNYSPFDKGTTNTINIIGHGASDANLAEFNDNMSDASISTHAGVTTVDFTSGTNAGQVVTTTDVHTLSFLDGTLHP